MLIAVLTTIKDAGHKDHVLQSHKDQPTYRLISIIHYETFRRFQLIGCHS
jgi:hypothetical protein